MLPLELFADEGWQLEMWRNCCRLLGLMLNRNAEFEPFKLYMNRKEENLGKR